MSQDIVKMYRRAKLTKLSFVVLLGLAGLAIVASVDWRLAVGVFLLQWSSNISNSVRD